MPCLCSILNWRDCWKIELFIRSFPHTFSPWDFDPWAEIHRTNKRLDPIYFRGATQDRHSGTSCSPEPLSFPSSLHSKLALQSSIWCCDLHFLQFSFMCVSQLVDFCCLQLKKLWQPFCTYIWTISSSGPWSDSAISPHCSVLRGCWDQIQGGRTSVNFLSLQFLNRWSTTLLPYGDIA